MLKIKLVYVDFWSRPTYETEEGNLLKDINLGRGPIYLTTTSSKDLESEPCSNIMNIEKYKDLNEIKIVDEF